MNAQAHVRPRRWRGELDLEVVYELNERVVEAVAARLEVSLTGAACRRAAHVPVALADVKFADARWWSAMSQHADVPEPCLARHPDALPSALSRAVLLVAWAVARHDATVARVLFGIVPDVADVLCRCPFADVENIAERGAGQFRPRFADHPTFWRTLIDAAHRDDRVTLSRLNVQAIQLLGAWAGTEVAAGPRDVAPALRSRHAQQTLSKSRPRSRHA